MFKVLLITIGIVILVLALSVIAISKGYSYKHTIDPLPDEKTDDKKNEE